MKYMFDPLWYKFHHQLTKKIVFMHKTVLSNMNSYKLREQKIQIYKMPFLDLFLMLSPTYYQTNATLAEHESFLLA